MNRRIKTLSILSLGGLAAVLFAGVLFNWYLKRDDDKFKKELELLTVTDDQPGILEVKVAFPRDLLLALDTPEKFRITYRVSDIPNSVKAAFAEATKRSTQEDVFSMAEPGSWPWNATDVILAGLPRRRLRSVAANESFCLVFYEHGGFAKSDDVAAFSLSGNAARAMSHSYLRPGFANLAGLRATIRERGYADNSY